MRNLEARRMILDVAGAIDAEPARYDQTCIASITAARWNALGQPSVWYVDERCEAWRSTSMCLMGWNHALHHAAEESVVPLPMTFDKDSGTIAVAFSRSCHDIFCEMFADFGLSYIDAEIIMLPGWTPKPGLTVVEALRKLASEGGVRAVTDRSFLASIGRL
jgi:hypothetical protein